MEQFTAYKNQFTGKAYQTKEACLRAEYHYLRKEVITALEGLIILPHVSLATQFRRIVKRLQALYEKGVEYRCAMDYDTTATLQRLSLSFRQVTFSEEQLEQITDLLHFCQEQQREIGELYAMLQDFKKSGHEGE